MKAAFLVHRMNSLHFYFPLAEVLKGDGWRVDFVAFKTGDLKPNSISLDRNAREMEAMAKLHGYPFRFVDDLDFDVVISHEGHGYRPSRAFHIMIQNFHDSFLRAQHPDSEDPYLHCDLFLANDPAYARLLKKIGFQSEILVAPLPCYWPYENISREDVRKRLGLSEGTQYALCFLPRPTPTANTWTNLRFGPNVSWNTGDARADEDHAAMVGEMLASMGFVVIYKQRIKNRNDRFASLQAYRETESWYPFTSIDLTYAADFAFGYMTTAIMDAAHFGTPYLNFRKDSYPDELIQLISRFDNKSFIRDLPMGTALGDVIIDIEHAFEKRSTKHVQDAFLAKLKRRLNETGRTHLVR